MEKRKRHYRKIIWIITVFQIVFCMFCMANMLKGKESYSFSENSLNISGGAFNASGVYSIDETSAVEGENCLKAGPLHLNPGVYQVSFYYQTDVEQVTSVKDESVGYRKLYANAVSLYPTIEMKECTYRFTLLEETEGLNITIKYTGTGSLQVSDVMLTHTRQEYSMLLVIAAFLFALVDFLVIYFGYCGKKTTKENRKIIYGLSLICIFSSGPLFVDYILWGDDQYFHLARIEGVARGWMNGTFPVRMQGYMLEGMGYPTSIMYGDVFLWLAAFLRFVGFDLAVAYKGYILFINVVTAIISFISFKNIFKDEYIGLWCSALYTLSLYRMYNVYVRSALGEYTAMLFWPFICWGLTRVLAFEIETVKSQKTMWILTTGYMGVLYCHVLSVEMAIIFTILICMICRKRFFRKETFMTFVKAAGLAIALSLWFIVPFLDYTLNVDMKVFHVGNPIQALGLYLIQLFWVFPWSGINNYMYVSGMQNVKAYGVGIGLVFVLLAFVYLYLQKKDEMMDTEDYQMARLSAGISAITCVMSLSLFPWDVLSEMSVIVQSMVYTIQFPYRLLSIATIALTVLAGYVFVLFRRYMDQSRWKSYAVIILFFTILPSLFFVDDNFQHTSWSDLREIASLGTKRVGNGEYIPYEMDMEELSYYTPIVGENVNLKVYEKRDAGADISCANEASKDSYVDCSLIYYPGYQAWDKATGEKMKIEAGNNQLLRVVIPGEYEGEIKVDFVGKTMWKIADIFSLCLWIMCIIVGYVKYKNYISGKVHEEKY